MCRRTVTSSIPFGYSPPQLATYVSADSQATFPSGPARQVTFKSFESRLSSLHVLRLLEIPLNSLSLQDVNVTIESVLTGIRVPRGC